MLTCRGVNFLNTPLRLTLCFITRSFLSLWWQSHRLIIEKFSQGQANALCSVFCLISKAEELCHQRVTKEIDCWYTCSLQNIQVDVNIGNFIPAPTPNSVDNWEKWTPKLRLINKHIVAMKNRLQSFDPYRYSEPFVHLLCPVCNAGRATTLTFTSNSQNKSLINFIFRSLTTARKFWCIHEAGNAFNMKKKKKLWWEITLPSRLEIHQSQAHITRVTRGVSASDLPL